MISSNPTCYTDIRNYLMGLFYSCIVLQSLLLHTFLEQRGQVEDKSGGGKDELETGRPTLN